MKTCNDRRQQQIWIERVQPTRCLYILRCVIHSPNRTKERKKKNFVWNTDEQRRKEEWRDEKRRREKKVTHKYAYVGSIARTASHTQFQSEAYRLSLLLYNALFTYTHWALCLSCVYAFRLFFTPIFQRMKYYTWAHVTSPHRSLCRVRLQQADELLLLLLLVRSMLSRPIIQPTDERT